MHSASRPASAVRQNTAANALIFAITKNGPLVDTANKPSTSATLPRSGLRWLFDMRFSAAGHRLSPATGGSAARECSLLVAESQRRWGRNGSNPGGAQHVQNGRAEVWRVLERNIVLSQR
jgi:hypothetical protein